MVVIFKFDQTYINLGDSLHRWMALRLAVENEWGGRDSKRKADELIDDVLQWFTSKRGMLWWCGMSMWACVLLQCYCCLLPLQTAIQVPHKATLYTHHLTLNHRALRR